MKNRLRKKYNICRCTHDKSLDEAVKNDPSHPTYINPMYVRWFYCARQPLYNNKRLFEIKDDFGKTKIDICINCPSFTVSRKDMREWREEKKRLKKCFRHVYNYK